MDRDADAQAEHARRRRPGPRALLVAGLVLAVALVVTIGVLAFRLGAVSAGPAAAASPRPVPSQSADPTVAEIAAAVGPSVVVIRTPQDLGTGVVAAEDGTILTANHVVAQGGPITVTFSDGATAGAEVADAEPERDIATLRLTSTEGTIVPAVLGGGAEVGAPVVAIGNPLGLAYSVSSGVVSGLDRQGRTPDGEFEGLIQFDASVNPGSSGGPLLDGQGTVIGIVVSIADPGRDEAFAGIGFAVPIEAALGGGGEGEGPGGGPRI